MCQLFCELFCQLTLRFRGNHVLEGCFTDIQRVLKLKQLFQRDIEFTEILPLFWSCCDIILWKFVLNRDGGPFEM